MSLHDFQLWLLTALTWRCRVAIESHLAVAVNTSPSRVRRALRSLQHSGLLDGCTVTVIDFELQGPLVTSDCSPATRGWGAVAWELEHRWAQSPRRRARITWARQRATRVVGGVGGRLRQALQLQHDLGVAEIWARRGQDAGPRWLSEDAYRAHCQLERKSKVPDAVILDTRAPDKHGALLRVIEFGGRYSRQRLENFHRFWSRRGVDYEIW